MPWNNGRDFSVVTNLQLPVHPNMLDISNKTRIATIQDGAGIPASVSTAYYVLELAHEEGTGNVSPKLYTRPAANIIFLGLAVGRAVVKGGQLVIGLIRRERPAVGDDPGGIVTKACGGYFHDGSTGDLEAFTAMIRRYVGIKVNVEDLYLCGNTEYGYVSDPGHGSIRTPIAFTYATKFEVDPGVTPKMELIWMPLDEAVGYCFQTLNNLVGTRIEDTSSILSILNLQHLIATGEITAD